MNYMKKSASIVSIFILIFVFGAFNSSISAKKKITVVELHELKEKKQLIKKGNAQAVADFNQLMKEAQEALNCPLFSVARKRAVPPSGSKHDYMSLAPYFWPNPDTADGLPYIRKDGQINPDTRNDFTDFVELQNFFNHVQLLRDAFYFSGDKAYAHKALQLINTWFMDEKTKMNPNLNYGQGIPGLNDGREFGIIEFAKLIEVIKCVELFDKHKLLDKQTEAGMRNWLTEYAYWLQNSTIGKDASSRHNNHGTYYDGQLLSVLVYLGRIDEVKNHLSNITINRIFTHLEPDGSQPLELARTKSFTYSVMNLHGFVYLMRLGQKVGVDIFNATSQDGRSIKKAYQYFMPYLLQEKEWEYEQITDTEKDIKRLLQDLRYIKRVFKCKDFDNIIERVEKEKLEVLFRK